MSCEKYEIELFESFGINTLSEELQTHVDSCASCKAIFENLQSVATGIGSDDLFYESEETVSKRVEAVNNKIDDLEISKVVDVKSRWKSYVPMVAALMLVVGVGLITKVLLQFDNITQMREPTKTEILFVSLSDAESQSLNEIEFSEFVESYTTEFRLDKELDLLDDISEEEYKYLEENLNIGEIL